MKRLVLVTLALLCTSTACSGDSTGYSSQPPPPPPPAPPPPPPPPGTATVDVQDNQFNPQTVTITHGNTVTWTWRGAVQHNVTFQDGVGSSSSMATGTLDRTFSTAGTYRYRCTLHSQDFTSQMSGSVVVQ